AAAKAESAEAAANRAAQYAQDANSKLDNKFKRSMMK
ncbi:MAG: alanine-zipper protein, partial [Methylobacter sp.]